MITLSLFILELQCLGYTWLCSGLLLDVSLGSLPGDFETFWGVCNETLVYCMQGNCLSLCTISVFREEFSFLGKHHKASSMPKPMPEHLYLRSHCFLRSIPKVQLFCPSQRLSPARGSHNILLGMEPLKAKVLTVPNEKEKSNRSTPNPIIIF